MRTVGSYDQISVKDAWQSVALVDAIPTEAHDIVVDAVVTEVASAASR